MPHSVSPDYDESVDLEKPITQTVDSKLIYPNPYKPLQKLSAKELCELSLLIRSESDSYPLTVQREGDPKAPRFRLLSEEKYLRAYLYANVTEIPCIIHENALASQILTFPKNYFEEADLLHTIYAEDDVSEEEIARYFQASVEHCRQTMLLHNLNPTERKILLKSKISADAAICFYHLNKKEKCAVYRAIINEGLFGKDAEDMIYCFSRSKAKILIKSIGLFYNSIDKAVKTMNLSGIPVQMIREDNDSHTSITITISNATDEHET